MRRFSATSFEVYSTLALLCWALVLLGLGTAFDGESGDYYSPMFALAPQRIWGAAFLLVGGLQVFRIAFSYWTGRPLSRVRKLVLMITVCFWSLLATTALVGDKKTAGWMLDVLLAFGNMWAYSKVDRAEDEELTRESEGP